MPLVTAENPLSLLLFRLKVTSRLTRPLSMARTSRSVLVLSNGRAPRLKLMSRLHRCMTARKNVLQAEILGPRKVMCALCLVRPCAMVVEMCESSLEVVPCAKARFRTPLGSTFRLTRATTWWATAQAPLELVFVIMIMLLHEGVRTMVVRLGSLANPGAVVGIAFTVLFPVAVLPADTSLPTLPSLPTLWLP